MKETAYVDPSAFRQAVEPYQKTVECVCSVNRCCRDAVIMSLRRVAL